MPAAGFGVPVAKLSDLLGRVGKCPVLSRTVVMVVTDSGQSDGLQGWRNEDLDSCWAKASRAPGPSGTAAARAETFPLFRDDFRRPAIHRGVQSIDFPSHR